MPEITLERIAQKLPRLRLLNTYGSTETTSPAVFLPPEEAVARKEYVGLTVPCGHIVVMDEDGREVRPNTPGELYIGGYAHGRAGILERTPRPRNASSRRAIGSPATSG